MSINLIHINVPLQWYSEYSWACNVIFSEMLEIDFSISPSKKNEVNIALHNKSLKFTTDFFSQSKPAWLKSNSVPTNISQTWDIANSEFISSLINEPLPVLFGKAGAIIDEDCIKSQLDILGSIFFMLSRYEEVALTDRDEHNRFSAFSSLAFKSDFLFRPIVDEYVELLFSMMVRLWPELEKKERKGKIRISCDVDEPYDSAIKNSRKLFKLILGDLIKRRNALLALKRILNTIFSKFNFYIFDPYNTFDWYLDACEKQGHVVMFYIISGNTAGDIDGSYTLTEHRIKNLLLSILNRGHKVGVHGSYNTYNSQTQIETERKHLTEIVKALGGPLSVDNNRQHFLRWDTLQTPDILNSAGFKYDSTGSFADSPGFRFGTSKPFTMWSWQKNSSLEIKQLPLIVMESSVIATRYLGLGYSDEATTLFLTLKERSLRFGGDFNLLWHNSHLLTKKDKRLFLSLIS